MNETTESSCRACPAGESCRSVRPPAEAEDVPPGRVVGQSIAYFLLPIVAAIAAAAAADGELGRIVAGCSAFAGAVILAAGGGHLLRRRSARARAGSRPDREDV